MLEVPVEQRLHVAIVHRAAHLPGGPLDDPFGGGAVLRVGRFVWNAGDDRRSALGTDLDDKAVTRVVQDLGHGKIEIASHLRPRAHRDAETRAACLAAVDRDDEHLLPPRCIVGVHKRSAAQDLVLNRDRVELARTRTNERQSLERFELAHHLDTFGCSPGPPEPPARHVKELLPGVRPRDVSEQGRIGSAGEPEGSGLLHVGDTNREVGNAAQRVVDDRAVPHGRTHNPIAVLVKRVEQPVEVFASDDAMRGCGHMSIASRSVPQPG